MCPTGIFIKVIHDPGDVGEQWKLFVENLFTIDLPEEYRDLGIEVETACIDDIGGDDVDSICNERTWKIFLLSYYLIDEINNPESTMRTSELLKSFADRTILLLLTSDDDTAFVTAAQSALQVFPNSESFHKVRATNPDKIFNDLLTIISPIAVVFHPHVLSAEDTSQHVTIIANKPYPALASEKSHFVVEFGDGATSVVANLYNQSTVLFQNPGHVPGVCESRLFLCDPVDDDDGDEHSYERVQIGDAMQVWFQSDLDQINAVLERVANPYDFLCNSLNLRPGPDAQDQVDRSINICCHNTASHGEPYG